MSQVTIILAIWRFSTLLQIGLCVKLLATGLWRPYRRFTFYMAGLIVESGILFFATHPAWLYQRLWTCTRLILLVLQLSTVFEIFSRWAQSHRNIGRFGQRLFLVLMVLATGLSIATVPAAWSSKGWGVFLYVGLIANGALQFGAGAFMVLMLAFFAKFGGPVAPNLRWHALAMTTFSIGNAIAYFLFARRIASFSTNVLQQVMTIGALLFWIAALKKSGEGAPEVSIDPHEAEEAEETNRQMLEFAETVRQQRERETR